jgi:hypothetical protein
LISLIQVLLVVLHPRGCVVACWGAAWAQEAIASCTQHVEVALLRSVLRLLLSWA